eukprot:6554174-Prymnesium_polylepis.1
MHSKGGKRSALSAITAHKPAVQRPSQHCASSPNTRVGQGGRVGNHDAQTQAAPRYILRARPHYTSVFIHASF